MTVELTEASVPLPLVALASLVAMTLYELVKQSLYPDITTRQSHAATVVFGTLLATTAASFVVRRYKALHGRAIPEWTRGRRAEEALRQSEERSRELFENANDLVFTIDLAGNFTSLNKAGERLTGYARDEAMKMNIAQVVAPEHLGLARRMITSKLMDSAPTTYELEVVANDGRRVSLEVSTRLIYQAERPVGVQGIARDISARMRAEKALRESEARYQRIAANAPGMVYQFVLHPDGSAEFPFVSEGCREVYGLEPEEVVRDAALVINMIHPDDRPGFDGSVAESARSLSPWKWEGRFTHRSGEQRWIQGASRPERLSNGGIIWDGLLMDITERKQAEEALRESEARYRTVTETASDAIITVDQQSTILFANTAAEKIFGYTVEEMVGTRLSMLLPGDLRHMHEAGRQHYVETGKRHIAWEAVEVPGLHKSGREVPLEISFGKFEQDGKHIFTGIIRDITERQRAEQALRRSEEYHKLFRLANDAILIFNPEGEIVLDINDKACEAYGIARESFIGRSLKEISVDVRRGEQQLEELLERGTCVEFETAQFRVDGTQIHFLINSSVIEFRGRPAVLSINRDVTERRHALEAIKESEERYRDLVQNANDIIYTHDLEGNFTSLNKAGERVTGYSQKEAVTMNIRQVVAPEYLERAYQMIAQKLTGEGRTNYELEIITCVGQRRWLDVSSRVIRQGGVAVGVQGIARDVTDRKRAEEQLLYVAVHDGLTGLPNRALFMDHLKLAAERAKRREGRLFAVLFLDLDRFKVVNDSLGHSVGDKLLIEIGALLLRCVRPGDTVARLGGDEFTILLEDINGEQDARAVADRIQAELTAPLNLDGYEVFTSASIGIRLWAGGACSELVQDLLRDADTAMYRAKQLGKARAEMFDEAMHHSALELMQIETDLRRAVEREEFCLYYQPIVALESGKLIGFEALVRWQHPERGVVSPATFIPLAEETGLIIPLGQWVLAEACRQMREWQRRYRAMPPLMISVNISSKQFVQSDLVGQVTRVLEETGLGASSLKLEITESVMMEDYDTALKMLTELRELGVELSMDDFGTGYSSLSYLHRFPVGTLKIDRTFIDGMGKEGESGEIVRTIITLAQNLGIKVVAEGVETRWQHERLRALGCGYGQGYLYSRALRVEQAEGMLARQADAGTISTLSLKVCGQER